ncbi:hypothetical protein HK405_012897 [Cladochytrium tenue]|nr:hypothetical protein HK405_012897 [Cladochytrium tenue]
MPNQAGEIPMDIRPQPEPTAPYPEVPSFTAHPTKLPPANNSSELFSVAKPPDVKKFSPVGPDNKKLLASAGTVSAAAGSSSHANFTAFAAVSSTGPTENTDDETSALVLDPQLTAGTAPASELLRLNGFPGTVVDVFAQSRLTVDHMLAIADDALRGRRPNPGSVAAGAAAIVAADPTLLLRLTSLASAIRGARWGAAGHAGLATVASAGAAVTRNPTVAPPAYEETRASAYR